MSKRAFGILLLLVGVVFAYRFFYLVPTELFTAADSFVDVALVLVWGALVWMLFRSKNIGILRNPITWYILGYLLIVATHVALASLYYGQSLLQGVIAARWQGIYLVFFVYLLVLNDDRSFMWLLEGLSVLALIVLILATINYFGPTILYNEKAEDWGGVRAGIQRVFVPGMALVSIAFIWQYSNWLTTTGVVKKYAGILALVFISGHFFQQSRGGIFGVMLVAIVALVLARKYKEILYAGIFGVLMVSATGTVMKENIFLYPFTSGVTDLSQGSGTVSGRLKTAEIAFNEFKQHPWIGSGIVAIRTGTFDSLKRGNIKALTYQSDLGYAHWLKNYGLLGALWLAGFLWVLWTTSWRVLKRRSSQYYALDIFSFSYILFVTFTMVTLNHLMYPERILLLLLVAAILVRRAHTPLMPDQEEKAGNMPETLEQDGQILAKRRKWHGSSK